MQGANHSDSRSYREDLQRGRPPKAGVRGARGTCSALPWALKTRCRPCRSVWTPSTSRSLRCSPKNPRCRRTRPGCATRCASSRRGRHLRRGKPARAQPPRPPGPGRVCAARQPQALALGTAQPPRQETTTMTVPPTPQSSDTESHPPQAMMEALKGMVRAMPMACTLGLRCVHAEPGRVEV